MLKKWLSIWISIIIFVLILVPSVQIPAKAESLSVSFVIGASGSENYVQWTSIPTNLGTLIKAIEVSITSSNGKVYSNRLDIYDDLVPLNSQTFCTFTVPEISSLITAEVFFLDANGAELAYGKAEYYNHGVLPAPSLNIPLVEQDVVGFNWDSYDGVYNDSFYLRIKSSNGNVVYSVKLDNDRQVSMNVDYSEFVKGNSGNGNYTVFLTAAVHDGNTLLKESPAASQTFTIMNAKPVHIDALKWTADVGSVTFEWDISSNSTANRYSIQIQGKGWIEDGYVTRANDTHLSYICKNLMPNTSYKIKIEAQRVIGNTTESLHSEMRDVITLALTAPSGFNSTGQTNSTVSLAWNPVPGAASYSISSSTQQDGHYQITEYGITGTSCTISNLDPGKMYYFKIVAIYGTIASPDASCSAKTQELAVPGGLAASDITTDSISLSWSAVGNASGYILFRSIFQNIGYAEAHRGNTTSFKDIGLNPGTTYYYKIVAVFDNGTSSQSSAISASTLSIPATVRNFRAVAKDGGVQLSWSAVANAKEYELYRFIDDTNFVSLKTTDDTQYFDDYSILPNTSYTYMIRAVDANGTKSDVARASVVTPKSTKVPVAPLGLTVIKTTKDSITLAWNSVPDTLMYHIFIQQNDPDASVEKIISNKTVYTFTDLKEDTEYILYVTAVNDIGSSPDSNTVKARTKRADDPVNPFDLRITNPTESSLTLVWEEQPAAARYEIYRADTPDGKYNKVGETAGDATTYTDKDLFYDTVYYYQVRVFPDPGEFGASDIAEGITLPPLPISFESISIKPIQLQPRFNTMLLFPAGIGVLALVMLIILVVIRRKKKEENSDKQNTSTKNPGTEKRIFRAADPLATGH